MARIYETQEDVQREQLHQEINTQKARGDRGFLNVMIGALLTYVAYDGPAKEVMKEIAKKTIEYKNPILHKIGIGLGVVYTLFGIRTGVLGYSKQRKAEKELAQLGPEQVVFPDNVKIPHEYAPNQTPLSPVVMVASEYKKSQHAVYGAESMGRVVSPHEKKASI